MPAIKKDLTADIFYGHASRHASEFICCRITTDAPSWVSFLGSEGRKSSEICFNSNNFLKQEVGSGF